MKDEGGRMKKGRHLRLHANAGEQEERKSRLKNWSRLSGSDAICRELSRMVFKIREISEIRG
jgi:hypothetical protein